MTDRRRFLQGAMLAGAAALASFPAAADDDPWAMADKIVARIKPPHFPPAAFPVTAFGAVGDGKTDCSEAFARAVSACHLAGGGRVEVPVGDFLTGPIHLKSNVNLHLARGATVRFSRDPKRYLPLVLTRWEGVELMNYSPLIYAFEQENVAVTGAGTLDGQADNEHWWSWKGKRDFGWKDGVPHQEDARKRLFQMGDDNVPVHQRLFGEGWNLRPGFFEPYRCKNVMIEGVNVKNMPFWEIHPVLCTNIIVRGLTVDSIGPNTDGCDPESCTDVLIENCIFNTGDDCIAIKSGRNGDGRRVNVPSQYIVIRNCTMKNGHGAVTIGSEITGGVRWVFAENCRMSSPHLDHALRFKDNAYRGGRLEHFYFRHIAIGEVAHAALTIDFNYEEGARGNYPASLTDVHVERLVCDHAGHAIDVEGLPNAKVADITLTDCDFRRVDGPNIVKYVDGLKLKNVRINGRRV